MTVWRTALQFSVLSVSVFVGLLVVCDDFAVADAVAGLLTAAAPAANAPAAVDFDFDLEFARVSTSDEFQEAMRRAVKHIVVVDHINMTQAPKLEDLLRANAVVAGIYIVDGRVTESIRVRSFCRNLVQGAAHDVQKWRHTVMEGGCGAGRLLWQGGGACAGAAAQA